MENRKAKILFNKSGGTASKRGTTNRVTLPTLWIKEMGITFEDRNVLLTFDGQQIIIRKI